MTSSCWRKRSGRPTCRSRPTRSASRRSEGEPWRRRCLHVCVPLAGAEGPRPWRHTCCFASETESRVIRCRCSALSPFLPLSVDTDHPVRLVPASSALSSLPPPVLRLSLWPRRLSPLHPSPLNPALLLPSSHHCPSSPPPVPSVSGSALPAAGRAVRRGHSRDLRSSSQRAGRPGYRRHVCLLTVTFTGTVLFRGQAGAVRVSVYQTACRQALAAVRVRPWAPVPLQPRPLFLH